MSVILATIGARALDLTRRLGAIAVPVLRRASAPPSGHGLLYVDEATGRLALRTSSGTTQYTAGGAGGGASVGSATPQPLGSASAGASAYASRQDHVHAMPSASDVGADPAGTASSAVAAHAAAGDPHPGYALESALGTAATRNVGTGSGDVAAGDAPAAAQAAAEATAGAALAAHAGDTSLHVGHPSRAYANAAWGRRFQVQPGGNPPGEGIAVTSAVTPSMLYEGRWVYQRFVGNVNAMLGWRGNPLSFLDIGAEGTLYLTFRLPSLTGYRLWLGWGSLLPGATATAAGAFAGLQVDVPTRSSAAVHALARDGTTQSSTSTGVTLVAGTTYRATVRNTASGVYVAIAAIGTDLPAEVMHGSNLPASATGLGLIAVAYCTTGSGTFDIAGINFHGDFPTS